MRWSCDFVWGIPYRPTVKAHHDPRSGIWHVNGAATTQEAAEKVVRDRLAQIAAEALEPGAEPA